ncbi:MAG: AgmX/PglI C-terminal domain-containing protein [Myxococcales bacterium]|nr:AgmX/PglI C-terminal domain-containing protein [Myxococcales bacterium]
MPEHTPSPSRPGAVEPTSAVSSAPRERRLCARVAYAHGDRVRQSMRVPALADLRVGSSERNELVLCDARLGETHTLLEREGERWWLVVPRGVEVRARLGDQSASLEEHLRAGRAVRRGPHVALPLGLGEADVPVSAVLELGEGRLMIALEERTAARVAPLPRALSSGVGAQVDWRFAGTLAVVALAFFFVGLAAEAADPLLAVSPPESVFRFRPLYDTPPLPPPDAPPEPDAEVAALTEQDVPSAPRNSGDRTPRRDVHDGDVGQRRVGDSPRLSADEARSQTQELLGSIGSLGLRDRLAGGAVVSNAGTLLDDVREGPPNSGPQPGTLAPRAGRDTSGRSLGALGPAGVTRELGEAGEVEERPVRVGMARPQAPTGPGLRPQEPVTRAIRGRIAAIRRCYERTLAQHPEARGRVVVAFRVEMSGSFSGVSVTENATGDAQLATCMSGIFERLRVAPSDEGGAVSFRYPFVFEPG